MIRNKLEKPARFIGFFTAILWSVLSCSTPIWALSNEQDPESGPAKNPSAIWESEIKKFEAADAQQMPEKGGVLFVGSSSIRLWDTDKWFPDEKIINRGFGGSQIADVIYFADRIVWKYEPKIIFLYAGDNDIAAGKTADQVVADFEKFRKLASENLPDATVVFFPIKPSTKRWHLWPLMNEANQRIRKSGSVANYVDTIGAMQINESKPAKSWFVEDGLHLSRKGYQHWTDVTQKHLQALRIGMRITGPPLVRRGETGNVRIEAYILSGGTKWKVQYRFGPNDEWAEMGRSWNPFDFRFLLPEHLDYGEYEIEIVARSEQGNVLKGSHYLKVTEE